MWSTLSSQAHRLLARQHGVASTRQLLDTRLARRDSSSACSRSAGSRARAPRRLPDAERTGHRAQPVRRSVCSTARRRHRRPDGRTSVGVSPAPARPSDPRARASGEQSGDRHDGSFRTARLRGTITTSSSATTASASRHGQRTAFDLARWLGPDDLLSVIEQAAHDGRLERRRLHRRGRRLDLASTAVGSRVPPGARPSIAGWTRRVASRGPRRRGAGAAPECRGSSASTASSCPATATSGSTSPFRTSGGRSRSTCIPVIARRWASRPTPAATGLPARSGGPPPASPRPSTTNGSTRRSPRSPRCTPISADASPDDASAESPMSEPTAYRRFRSSQSDQVAGRRSACRGGVPGEHEQYRRRAPPPRRRGGGSRTTPSRTPS